MYETLQPNLITATAEQRSLMEIDPTYVVEKQMFLQNAFPYLEVRRPFILGTQKNQWRATIAHRFFELLHTKTDKLTRIYTQNIDGLDYQCTDIPKEKILNVHGKLCEAACEVCGTDVDFDDFCDSVKTSIKNIYDKDDASAPSSSKPIRCQSCGNPTVKPKTVLFGGSLPDEFFNCVEEDCSGADLLIVAGTSLVVSPANSLVTRVGEDCKRLVVNMDPVGQEFGIDYCEDTNASFHHRRDFFAPGNCEDMFLELLDHLEWTEDLKKKSHLLPPSSAALL